MFCVLVLIVFAFSADLYAQDFKYAGSAKCKMCHNSKAKGAQFKVWSGGQHSKAFATLGTPRAKEVAATAGVSGDPQKADECLVCHSTGHGAPATQFIKTFKASEGVGCESCHGPGDSYRKPKVMSSKNFKADPVAAVALYKENGLITPDEKVCLKCHNEKSPTYKKFVFAERVKLIAHPNPKNVKK